MRVLSLAGQRLLLGRILTEWRDALADRRVHVRETDGVEAIQSSETASIIVWFEANGHLVPLHLLYAGGITTPGGLCGTLLGLSLVAGARV